jgi:hypothetical protein
VARRGRGAETWAEVCALLDDLPDGTVRAHVEEIDAELGGWPALNRYPWGNWVRRLRAEGQEPRLLLCRMLGLAPYRSPSAHAATDGHDELWRALDSPDIARIHTLSVAYCGIDEATAPLLARKLARIRVTRLELSDNRIGAGIRHLLPLSLDGVFTSLDTDWCALAGAFEVLAAEQTAFASPRPTPVRCSGRQR